MIEVRVAIEDDHSFIGNFKFQSLPRKGDEITVPWPDDPYGVRIFAVDEVRLMAEGATIDWVTDSVTTELYVTEIT